MGVFFYKYFRQKDKGVMFIDGDSVPPEAVYYMRSVFSKDADISKMFVFGGRKSKKFKKWQKVASKHPEWRIEVCTLNREKVKNGADMMMQKRIDAFVSSNNNIKKYSVASSDYDLTFIVDDLCSRGYDVLGFGESNTPPEFQNSCTHFKLLTKEVFLAYKGQMAARSEDDESMIDPCLFDYVIRTFDEISQGRDRISKTEFYKELRSGENTFQIRSDYLNWSKILIEIGLFELSGHWVCKLERC